MKIQDFIPFYQLVTLRELQRGEERAFFLEKEKEIQGIIDSMPKSYETDGQGDKAICHLHFFGGSVDIFLTEVDIDEDGEGQRQAFGLVNLGYGPELGYVDLLGWAKTGKIEIDLHWTPKTLGEIKKEMGE